MVSMTRREQNRADTLQQIKDVARAIMTAQGTAGLSLRAIAAQMRIAVSALYRYYPSRDELVTALIIDANEDLGHFLREADQAHPRDAFTGRLMAVGGAYRLWALSHPTEFQLIFGNPIPGYVAPSERTRPAATNAGAIINHILADAIAAGFYTPPAEFAGTASPMEQHFQQLSGEPMRFSGAIIYLNLVLWSEVHGHTVLELHNHFDRLLGGHTEEFFNRHLISMLRVIGWPI